MLIEENTNADTCHERVLEKLPSANNELDAFCPRLFQSRLILLLICTNGDGSSVG